jgi:hypothetical protein
MSDATYTDRVAPDEIVPLTIKFGALTASPSNPVITVSRFDGAADNRDLSVILIGQPAVVGTDVKQIIGYLQAGTTYEIRCLVTTPENFKYGHSALVLCEVR